MKVITFPPSDTVDGQSTKRADLEVIKINDNKWIVIKKFGNKQIWWDDYDEDTCDDAVLCVGTDRYDVTVYNPISWSTYGEAQKWINEGCIAEIQESLMILDVGFRKELIVRRY